MRPTVYLLASTLFLISQAQLLPFLTNPKPQPPAANNKATHQLPMANDDRPSGSLTLSDVLGTDSMINIFAGFTRDIDSISSRLDNAALNTTVLAPLNTAITALPRKPWEDPREYAAFGTQAYDGLEGEDRAQRNLRRFTESHVVPVSPWKEGETVERIGGGGKVWWERVGEKCVVRPQGVEIERVARKVGNGEVWVLKGVLDYAA